MLYDHNTEQRFQEPYNLFQDEELSYGYYDLYKQIIKDGMNYDDIAQREIHILDLVINATQSQQGNRYYYRYNDFQNIRSNTDFQLIEDAKYKTGIFRRSLTSSGKTTDVTIVTHGDANGNLLYEDLIMDYMKTYEFASLRSATFVACHPDSWSNKIVNQFKELNLHNKVQLFTPNIASYGPVFNNTIGTALAINNDYPRIMMIEGGYKKHFQI